MSPGKRRSLDEEQGSRGGQDPGKERKGKRACSLGIMVHAWNLALVGQRQEDHYKFEVGTVYIESS